MALDLEALRAALAVIAKHRDSHMLTALADAYSAQEYPRLRDAHDVAELALAELTARRARDAEVEALATATATKSLRRRNAPALEHNP